MPFVSDFCVSRLFRAQTDFSHAFAFLFLSFRDFLPSFAFLQSPDTLISIATTTSHLAHDIKRRPIAHYRHRLYIPDGISTSRRGMMVSTRHSLGRQPSELQPLQPNVSSPTSSPDAHLSNSQQNGSSRSTRSSKVKRPSDAAASQPKLVTSVKKIKFEVGPFRLP